LSFFLPFHFLLPQREQRKRREQNSFELRSEEEKAGSRRLLAKAHHLPHRDKG